MSVFHKMRGITDRELNAGLITHRGAIEELARRAVKQERWNYWTDIWIGALLVWMLVLTVAVGLR